MLSTVILISLNKDSEVQSVSQLARRGSSCVRVTLTPLPPTAFSAGMCDAGGRRAYQTLFCLTVFVLSELDLLKGRQQKTASAVLPFTGLWEGPGV